jgi:hypothetical protein
MKYGRYLRIEGYIAASDSGSVLERWRFGRRLLADDEAMSASRRSLKPGVVERLIAEAIAKGYKTLSAREIQYRLQAARMYESEDQIRKVLADLENWSGLIKAGFPPVQATLDTEPFDARDEDEKRRDAARELARKGQEAAGQLSLFPDDKYGEMSTLSELAKYAAEMAEITDRYARRDEERADYLKSLIDAVSGDMSKTWGEAQAALEASA